jgi:hypothetical protein
MKETKHLSEYFNRIISKNWKYLTKDINSECLGIIKVPQVHICFDQDKSKTKLFVYIGTSFRKEKENLILQKKVNKLILNQAKYVAKLLYKRQPSKAFPIDNPSAKYCGSVLIYQLI